MNDELTKLLHQWQWEACKEVWPKKHLFIPPFESLHGDQVRTLRALAAKVQKHIDKERKAFGGCTHCYGKGYSTEKYPDGAKGTFKVNPCVCDRGEQIEKILGQQHIPKYLRT